VDRSEHKIGGVRTLRLYQREKKYSPIVRKRGKEGKTRFYTEESKYQL
jgi:DNA-binding transcriptional MerR regulator